MRRVSFVKHSSMMPNTMSIRCIEKANLDTRSDLILVFIAGCTDNNKYVETKSTITNKDVLDSNQYFFYASYEIEGREGLNEVTIKVKNKTEYDQYEVGDEYIFKRQV